MSPRLRRTAALSAAAVLVLSGCAGDADAELRAAVADLTASANGRDADAVRTDAQTVLDRLDAAQRSGDVDTAQATVIRERTLAVQAAADSIDAEMIARLEAEQAEQEAQQEQERLDAEREAAEAAAEAERQRLEQERLDAEAEAEAEAREEAEEEARKAAEQAAKEAEKQAEEQEDEEEAERRLERALELHVRAGAAPFASRTRYQLARLKTIRDGPGDAERASLLIEQVVAEAGALGMARLVQQAGELSVR